MKISITRILAELKLLESKIVKSSNVVMVGLYQEKSKYVKGTALNKSDFEKHCTSNFQSMSDLIIRYEKLRSALSVANATNMVKIGKQTMSISEAITLKEKVIPIKVNLLNKLRASYNLCLTQSESFDQELDQKVEAMLEQNLGNDRKADKEAYENIAKPFISANRLNLLDPANIKDYIDKLELEIGEFTSEIDIALSEANANSKVDI